MCQAVSVDLIRKCKENLLADLCASDRYEPNTLNTYRDSFNHFVLFLLKLDTKEVVINQSIVDQYLMTLTGRNASIKTRALRIVTTRIFLEYMVKQNLITENSLTKFVNRRTCHRIPAFISVTDLVNIIALSREHKAKAELTPYQYYLAVRNHCIVEMLISTGVRPSELIEMKVADLDLESQTIQVLNKHKHNHIVYVGTHALRATKEWLVERANYLNRVKTSGVQKSENGWLFVNRFGEKLTRHGLYYIIREIGNKQHLHLYPYRFRHTFAFLLINKGVDIRFLQSFLGHKSVRSTMIYLYTDYTSLKKELEKAHPLAQKKAGKMPALYCEFSVLEK